METTEIIVSDKTAILESKSLQENFSAGLKITAIGMMAVFGVLIILYIVIKIMGQFAKGKKKEEK